MRFTFLLLDEPTQALHFYKKHKDKTRFIKGDKAFVLYDGEQIVAALKLSEVFHQSQSGFVMRSVLVDRQYRRKGLALLLIQQVIAYVDQKGRPWRCVCFPYDYLVPLYERCGFEVIKAVDLPPALIKSWQRYQTAVVAGRISPVLIMQVKSC